jgi:hypothetical protein
MPFIKQSFISFLVGMLCVVVGIAGVFLLSTNVSLDCIRSPRATDQCTIKATSLLRSHTQQIPLGNIAGADIETTTDWLRRRGSRTQYRVVLNTKTGAVPLTEGYSSGYSQHQRMADQITTFLRSRSQPSLHLEQADRWLGLIVGTLFGVGGVHLISRSIRRFDHQG